MHWVPYSCQNLSQNHCLSNLESVPTEHIPLLKPCFFDGIPPPCFLHLFNLFSVYFEPFPWKTWHNAISFYLNCYSGHVWNVRYSWALLEISVKTSFIGNPRDCSRILVTYTLHSIISWKAGLLCLVGEKVSWNAKNNHAFERDLVAVIFAIWCMYFSQAGEVLSQVWLMVLKTYSDPDFGQDLSEVTGELWLSKKKKNLLSFCLAGHGKAIVENVPDVRTPMNSNRDRHGCEGKTSVTLVPCFPFWVCPLCFPSCSKVLLSWRKWSMPWVVEVDHTACPKNPWLMYPIGMFLLMEIKGFGSQMGRHLGGKWLS